ncbi:MAG TPA: BON domain-containing protein [Candidatus Limnocylindrales bacterium]|nr:BON domain-containing protein [Candidatus Limnocylindrales bacterium]
MRNFNKLALIVALGSGFAIAQSTPASPSTAPSTAPSSTSQPSSMPDQQPSSTAPQSTSPATAPDQLPNTDQKKPDTQTPDQNKMPQSDAAPAAAATGDVQSTIQSAIQKDPSLASANVTVDVKNGKSVDLTGTVPSKDAKDAAERIAKENSGGLKVKNHLKVASASMPDKSDKSKSDNMSNPK